MAAEDRKRAELLQDGGGVGELPGELQATIQEPFRVKLREGVGWSVQLAQP